MVEIEWRFGDAQQYAWQRELDLASLIVERGDQCEDWEHGQVNLGLHSAIDGLRRLFAVLFAEIRVCLIHAVAWFRRSQGRN